MKLLALALLSASLINCAEAGSVKNYRTADQTPIVYTPSPDMEESVEILCPEDTLVNLDTSHSITILVDGVDVTVEIQQGYTLEDIQDYLDSLPAENSAPEETPACEPEKEKDNNRSKGKGNKKGH